jgi:uncharacterized protein YneF (UPF0154 family)
MSKKTLLIAVLAVVLLIILVIGGYIYWNKILRKTNGRAGTIFESITKGLLPSLGTNPLENKPDLNPVDKINPFKNIKINPFE